MPVITISRQEGSQGDTLARMVAERLGFVLVDRDTMLAAAAERGIGPSKTLAPEIDEKKPSFWERLDEERRRYKLLLRYLVYDYAERDRCIIVGHGADVFLAGLTHVLKLRVIASLETRVKRVMDRDQLSHDAAMNAVRQSDRQRADYVKYLFQVDWRNPELCDIIINTDNLQLPTIAQIIARVVEAPDLVPTAACRQMLSDRALTCRVEMRLLLDQRIGGSGVRVLASGGQVKISGTLATDEEREIIEELVQSTPGVSRMTSELVVVPITPTLYP